MKQLLILIFVFTLCISGFSLNASAQSNSTPSATPQESSSTQSSSIRDKVRQAIENLTNKPKAILGSLEQVSESTLQIKEEDGKLQQVATMKDTKYARVVNSKKSDIKFTDLAIGDFITALGFKNGNNVLESKRVVVYDKKPTLGREIIVGDIVETSKTSIKVTNSKTNESWTIETDKDTIFTKKLSSKVENVKFSDLEIGDKIITAGLLSLKKEKTIFAGAVRIIPTQADKKPSVKTSPTPISSPRSTPKPSPAY